jgi:hypothetical protein
VRTVRTLMKSCSAIWASVRPWATSVTSSRSRALSLASPERSTVVGVSGARHDDRELHRRRERHGGAAAAGGGELLSI